MVNTSFLAGGGATEARSAIEQVAPDRNWASILQADSNDHPRSSGLERNLFGPGLPFCASWREGARDEVT